MSEHTGAAPPVLGRRERKKQATRAALRDAALRLALRHGVDNVTVEQIADEADTALRTFFNYFSSKEEAMVAPVSAAAEQLIAQFRARPRAESVLRAFREAVVIVLNEGGTVSHDHIGALRLIRREPSLMPQQLAVLASQEQALAEAIAERVDPPGRDGFYPAVCAAAVLAALHVVLDRWLDQAAGLDQESATVLLGRQCDAAIAELTAGLDRPGSPDV
ncbi:TetR family transcriptional regulator [Nonomuraea longispora]|uniref:TetR family transcriptional regulator n=1 Tax=Nonomuraea longispora TaxID=1848320 RepID=A0A4R4NH86_9ACTN|nr:TetR/AcrR family transcriptional regulator [Nonomuraea longispora]TDC08395.1 TetR family transcriptional regulator [Nonomuraea longispora]